MKRFRVICLVLAIAAMTVSFSSVPATAEDDFEFMRIGTASLGGNFFPMGAAIAEVLSPEMEGHQFTPMATGGSAYNMGAIDRDELEIAISQGTAVAAGVNGTGAFEGNPTRNVRGIGQYHATPQHVIYSSKLEINELSDLKGKKIEMIAPGDGIEVATRKMLEAMGVSIEDIDAQHSGNRQQAASRLKTGQVDAMIDGTGVGAAWLVDVIGKGRFSLLNLSDSEIDTINSSYGEFSRAVIPAGSYYGQEKDIQTVANWTVILVRDDMPEDLVYEITKNLFAKKDELTQRHHYFHDLDPENIKGGLPVEMHKGAEKYYKEIGILE